MKKTPWNKTNKVLRKSSNRVPCNQMANISVKQIMAMTLTQQNNLECKK